MSLLRRILAAALVTLLGAASATAQPTSATRLRDRLDEFSGRFYNVLLAPDGQSMLFTRLTGSEHFILDLSDLSVSDPIDPGFQPLSTSFGGDEIMFLEGFGGTIHRYAGGTLDVVVDRDDTKPGSDPPEMFGLVFPGRRALSDGVVVFWLTRAPLSNSSVWISRGSTPERVWAATDEWMLNQQPKATFGTIYDASISGSRIAIAADAGVFVSDLDGTLGELDPVELDVEAFNPILDGSDVLYTIGSEIDPAALRARIGGSLQTA